MSNFLISLALDTLILCTVPEKLDCYRKQNHRGMGVEGLVCISQTHLLPNPLAKDYREKDNFSQRTGHQIVQCMALNDASLQLLSFDGAFRFSNYSSSLLL